MTFGERLKIQIKKNGFTMEELASMLNVGKGAVSHWCNDKRKPTSSTIKQIADILNISPNMFFDDVEDSIKSVPLVMEASCGLPIQGIEVSGKVYIDKSNHNSRMYAVVAVGDSMQPEIYDSDRVICDPEATVQNGDIVHYQRNNESAIKVYFNEETINITMFIPFNSNEDFSTVSIHNDDMDNVSISKVVDIISSKRNNRSARLKMIGR